MSSSLEKEDPSPMTETETLGRQALAVKALAERILLDHRENEHRVFLISSASEEDCVRGIGGGLACQLAKRCHVKLGVLEGSQNGQTPPLCYRLTEALKSDHDILLLIVPALVSEDFPATILTHCDTCVLVVQAELTRKVHVREALRTLEQHDVAVLGTVLFNTRQVIPAWFYDRCFGRLA